MHSPLRRSNRSLLARVATLAPASLALIAAAGAAGCSGAATGEAGEASQSTSQAIVPAPPVTPWAILLCKFTDHPEEPHPASYYADMFTESGEGQGGLFDYWRDQSYGQMTLRGSQVFGWKQTTLALADVPQNNVNRWMPIKACLEAHSTDISVTPFTNRLAIMNAYTDWGQVWGMAVLPPEVTVAGAAHEMGHDYSIEHANDDTLRLFGGGPGEYGDQWDVMGAGWGFAGLRWWSPPGTNAMNKRLLGWIPPARVYNWGSSTTAGVWRAEEVTLTSLSQPAASGYMTAYVKTDSGVAYSIELRTLDGWDRGLHFPAVLIHREGVTTVNMNDNGHDGGWTPGEVFHDPSANIDITIRSLDAAARTATVVIGLNHLGSSGGGGGGSTRCRGKVCSTM